MEGAGTYEYDANGNRTQYNGADGTVQRYTYDRENRLTTINYDGVADLPRSEFTYDGLGRRIGVTEYDAVGAVTSAQRYLYDGLDLVEVRDASEDTLAQIVHGPGIDNPLVLVDVTESPADMYYYHTDHLGSVRLITDDTGAAARTYDYSAYGVLIAESGTGASLNPFHYTGREYHATSGLYFYRARFYDPKVGSFISVDPIGLNAGINTYGYVVGNPILYADPVGLNPMAFLWARAASIYPPASVPVTGFLVGADIYYAVGIGKAWSLSRQRERENDVLRERLARARGQRLESEVICDEVARRVAGQDAYDTALITLDMLTPLGGPSTGPPAIEPGRPLTREVPSSVHPLPEPRPGEQLEWHFLQ